MDISVRSTSYQVEKQDWLGSRDGTEHARTVTLYRPAFTEGTHFPNGYVASGTTLAKITSGGGTGFWGPYDNAASDGRQVADGFLLTSTPMRASGPNVGAALHWRGVIDESQLPTNHGLDSAGKTDLAAKFRFE